MASIDAALSYVLDNEPEVLLPYLCFAAMDRVMEAASRFRGPVPRHGGSTPRLHVASPISQHGCCCPMLATPALGIDLRDEASASAPCRDLRDARRTRACAVNPRCDMNRLRRMTKGKTT